MSGLLAQVPLAPQYGPELATQLTALSKRNSPTVALWIARCAESLIPLVRDHPGQDAKMSASRVEVIEDAINDVRRSALKTDGGHSLLTQENEAKRLAGALLGNNPFCPPPAWYAAFICTRINPENDLTRALDVAWAMRRVGYTNDQLLELLNAAAAERKVAQ